MYCDIYSTRTWATCCTCAACLSMDIPFIRSVCASCFHWNCVHIKLFISYLSTVDGNNANHVRTYTITHEQTGCQRPIFTVYILYEQRTYIKTQCVCSLLDAPVNFNLFLTLLKSMRLNERTNERTNSFFFKSFPIQTPYWVSFVRSNQMYL